MASLAAGVAIATLVPRWTLAELSALNGAVDYAAAFAFGLIPGAAPASRCAARERVLYPAGHG